MNCRFAFLLCLILCGANVCAQSSSQSLWVSLADSLEMDGRSCLHYPSDSMALKRFYTKLDRLLFDDAGRISIVHLGGSHVQAGALSNRMRCNFLGLNAGSRPSRGFTFPYAVAKTNGPSDYKISYQGDWTTIRSLARQHERPLGLSGMAVCTRDSSASIALSLRQDSCLYAPFSRVTLYASDSIGQYEAVLGMADGSVVQGGYVDSMQQWLFDLPYPTDSFCLWFRPRSDTIKQPRLDVCVGGFLLENDATGLSYHAIGINGASLDDYLRCVNFQRDIAQLQPDMVILGIGINDAVDADFSPSLFYNRYDSLLTKLVEVQPEVALLFLTNNDSFVKRRLPNPNALAVQKVMFELASRYQGVVWDLFDWMGGLGSAEEWLQKGLMKPDLIHFTREGYELLGDCLFNALMDDYARQLLQRELPSNNSVDK